ncbi:MAG: CE1 family esterase, partial [Deltaproteobacteria bacterium]
RLAEAAGDGGIALSLGSGDAGPNDPPPGAQPAPTDGGPDPCSAGATPPLGDVVQTLPSSGGLRWFFVHPPAGYRPAAAPRMLVLNYHGFGSDPFQEALLSQMNGAADQNGFLAVYPAGINHAWNAGLCCGDPAWLGDVDDVQFTRDLIAAVSAEYCVDPKRIFATGMSNGAFLAHRLGCELSDRIAAIAPVAGVIGVPTCAPPRAVPVMHFHGTLDPLVPYYGGSPLGFRSVPESIALWDHDDGCTGLPTVTYQKGDSTCVERSGCAPDGDAVLCTVLGGGHTWPGGTPIPALGLTTSDLDATSMMVAFFQSHPLE